MCQVSVYLRDGDKEELLKENITRMEVCSGGLRISTLFEGVSEYSDMVLQQIDFSAGKVILEKQ